MACAMFRLGVCYAEGTGVAASMALAEDWICKAAKLEERFSAVAEALKDIDRPESMLDHPEQVAAVLQDYAEEGSNLCRWLLQSFYRYGLGVPQDSAAAEALLLQAAQEGFVPAMRTLAVTRQHGYEVEQDTPMALYWYDRAVQAGDAESMRMLAHWYTDGVDGVPNPDLAVKLYEQAVALKDTEAAFWLEEHYLSGTLPCDPALLDEKVNALRAQAGYLGYQI
jgi:TPR repeat protein